MWVPPAICSQLKCQIYVALTILLVPSIINCRPFPTNTSYTFPWCISSLRSFLMDVRQWSSVDRVPVSVSEWLFGSFVLILILFGVDEYINCHIFKEWDGNAVYYRCILIWPNFKDNDIQKTCWILQLSTLVIFTARVVINPLSCHTHDVQAKPLNTKTVPQKGGEFIRQNTVHGFWGSNV